jgi:hypothetical protein
MQKKKKKKNFFYLSKLKKKKKEKNNVHQREWMCKVDMYVLSTYMALNDGGTLLRLSDSIKFLYIYW